jgi:hypothetical protein
LTAAFAPVVGLDASPPTAWLNPFKSHNTVFASFCPSVTKLAAGIALAAPIFNVPTEMVVFTQVLPVELIVHVPVSVFAMLPLGRLIVPFKIPVPAPRINAIPVYPPPAAVMFPFTVSVAPVFALSPARPSPPNWTPPFHVEEPEPP